MTEAHSSQRSSKRVVILGASGFIGMNLVHALCKKGLEPVCVSRHERSDWPDGCQPIVCDIANPSASLLNELAEANVFHLAATTRPSQQTDQALSELIDNTAATVNLLEHTRNADCRWIFVSSGGTVYGQSATSPIGEDHPCLPISSYGVAKLATERYFHLYRALHDTDYVIARISNPYGPFQSASTGQGLIAVLLSRIANAVPVDIWGDGKNVRDYIYIDDAVSALQALADRGRSGSIYNVGSGTGLSIVELVEKISGLVAKRADINHKPARNIDVRSNVLDIGKIRRELGWRPHVDISDGLRRTHRWLDDQAVSGDRNSKKLG